MPRPSDQEDDLLLAAEEATMKAWLRMVERSPWLFPHVALTKDTDHAKGE